MEIWLNEVCDSSLTRYSKHLLLVIFHQCDIAIFCKLREFFQNNPSNHIEFWDCLSSDKWPPHLTADQETKFYSTQPLHPSQMSWKLSRKDECDSYLCTWQMYFQASNYKGKNFLRQQWQTNHSSNLFQRGSMAQICRPIKHANCMYHLTHHQSCSYWWIQTTVLPQQTMRIPMSVWRHGTTFYTSANGTRSHGTPYEAPSTTSSPSLSSTQGPSASRTISSRLSFYFSHSTHNTPICYITYACITYSPLSRYFVQLPWTATEPCVINWWFFFKKSHILK